MDDVEKTGINFVLIGSKKVSIYIYCYRLKYFNRNAQMRVLVAIVGGLPGVREVGSTVREVAARVREVGWVREVGEITSLTVREVAVR